VAALEEDARALEHGRDRRKFRFDRLVAVGRRLRAARRGFIPEEMHA
jgi:hypothetical protein